MISSCSAACWLKTMGTCGSKFCNCFRPFTCFGCRLPEEKLVISKSPPPTDSVLTCHDLFDSKLFTSSSSLSCSTTAATTATTTTTATTVSSPSSSSSSISINSDVLVLEPEMPSDAEMAKTVIGSCPQGAAPVPPSKATGAAAKQPVARARKPLPAKRPRSTSPAVRAGPKKSPGTAVPRRSSNTPFLLRAGSGSGALHGRRRCQACSPEGHAGSRQFAARKERVRAAKPRVSTGPRRSSVELPVDPAAACVHHDVDVQHQVLRSEVVQSSAESSETLSRVLITDELINNPLISMDCFIFL